MKMNDLADAGKTNPIQTQTNPNKANLLDARMNVNVFPTKDYENISNCSLAENKPNINPIQTQSKPISKEKNAPAYDN